MNTLRFWLAAGGLCAAATAFADAPKKLAPVPPPKIDFPGLPPVERIGGGFSEPTFGQRAAERPVVPVAAAPKADDAPGPPDKLPTLPPAPPAAACPADAADGPVAAGGKRTLHDKCTYTPQGNLRAKKIPPDLPPPHGAVVRGVFDRQKELAMGEYFVVYREDFLADTAELNDTGRRHLAGIFKRLDQTAATIKVEPTGSDVRDGKRRTAVLDALLEMGADSNVVARIAGGGSRAEGLRYEDVPAVGTRNPIAGRGGFGGGFGGGGGGLNGSGFGGGGFGGGGFGGGFGGGGFGGFR